MFRLLYNLLSLDIIDFNHHSSCLSLYAAASQISFSTPNIHSIWLLIYAQNLSLVTTVMSREGKSAQTAQQIRPELYKRVNEVTVRPAPMTGLMTLQKKGSIQAAEASRILGQTAGQVRLKIFGLWTKTSMRASCLVTFKFAYQIADILALILAIFILGVLSLYWACLFPVEQNLKFLRIYVVDFNSQVESYTEISPLLGPLITRTTEKMSWSPVPHLGYITLPPSHFNNDPAIVRQ